MPHIHEKIDFTAEVYIVYKNKVLLRQHDKYKFWLSVGGHIELDEDPNQAAVREVKEEVGLEVELYDHRVVKPEQDDYTGLIPPYFMNRHRINDTHEHLAMIYFARAHTDQLNQLSPGEKSDACRWFTKEEISNLDNTKETVKIYATKALELLGKSD